MSTANTSRNQFKRISGVALFLIALLSLFNLHGSSWSQSASPNFVKARTLVPAGEIRATPYSTSFDSEGSSQTAMSKVYETFPPNLELNQSYRNSLVNFQTREGGYRARSDSTGTILTARKLSSNNFNADGSTQTVYFNDFEGEVGSEWSNTSTETTPAGGRKFLGRLSNGPTSLTLNNLPEHTNVKVTFDLFIINTWDGNRFGEGQDIWDLSIEGSKLIHATFSNTCTEEQTYPDDFPGATHPPLTGKAEVGSLGFPAAPNANDPCWTRDSVYHISRTVDHATSSLVVNFSASNLEDISNESWGLDNVKIELTPPSSIAPGFPVKGNNWSMNADVSEDDGVVLHNVTLGLRYMAERISLPYYNLETSAFPKQRLQLKPAPVHNHPPDPSDDKDGRSRIKEFKITQPSGASPLTISATYEVDNIPKGSKSKLNVTQQYEFCGESIGCEPSETLPCSRYKPLVIYVFSGQDGETLTSINMAQRFHFQPDRVPTNTSAVFRDCDTKFGFGCVLSGVMPPFEYIENPMISENSYQVILKGKVPPRPKDTPIVLVDNYHQTWKEKVDPPSVTVTPRVFPPGSFDVAKRAGCPECSHIHWRWGASNGPDFNSGNPIINPGQDLEIAVLNLQPEEEDGGRDFHELVNKGEPLTNQVVYWQSATSYNKPTDSFFTHSHFFSSTAKLVPGKAFLKVQMSFPFILPKLPLVLANNAPLSHLSAQGSNMSYTITVTNDGPDDATGVDLIDVLPVGTTFVSATSTQGSCYGPTEGLLGCNLGSLAAGASATMTLVITTTSAGIITNWAYISGEESDPYTEDNLASVSISTTTTALTSLNSSVNPSDFGQSVTFTATVTSGAGIPTGTAQFKDNGTNIGGPVALNASGVATFATSTLTTGTHAITADYSGDANFASSSGTLAGGQRVRALSINDVSITEGDSSAKTLNFTAKLSAANNLSVKVDFATGNETAKAGSDYVATNGTLTFNPGDVTKTIGVTINGDQTFEPGETFTVNLSNPVNATISKAQGTGTILNDDAQGGTINFSQPNYTVSESGGSIAITVVRTGDISAAATVDYATPDDSAATPSILPCSTPGFATPRCDFTTATGTLRFAPGESLKTFTVLISQDNYVEAPETLPLTLSNLTGGAVFGAPSIATLTITDDLIEPPTNPVDDTGNFVRQHYHDFLNREPDADGFAFWTSQIDNCAPKPQCTEVMRVNVSASFFLSIEFQETGFLVERIYKASYGDATGLSTLGGAHQLSVPIAHFSEFLPDTQRIGQGVVVGVGNWRQQLEDNKVAFTTEFVQRSLFTTTYATTLTPAQFVDSLFLKTGVTPSTAERQAAINEFAGALTTGDVAARARALRRVAENATFTAQEFNRAFVLMEYLGYLRRNPNAAPDADHTGYDFWLTKLNNFKGNYLDAEMVKAFITSFEYRKRSGLQ